MSTSTTWLSTSRRASLQPRPGPCKDVTEQGEIGLFGIKIEGEEEYFIEAVEKWVSPWENHY